jgi:hypothetical protein
MRMTEILIYDQIKILGSRVYQNRSRGYPQQNEDDRNSNIVIYDQIKILGSRV